MAEQRMFAGLAWSRMSKVTRRERSLAEMNAVMPWARLVKLIEPTGRTSLRDPSDMAEAIWRMWTDDVLSAEVAQGASRRAEVFSWSKCARRTLAFLQDVAGSSGAMPARAVP